MEARHKYSRKRQAILEMLQGTKEHPSAETIYNKLKPDIPDLSLATVYRNLSAFQNEGLAAIVATVAGNERYDACTVPHPHFICRKCGNVIDLQNKDSINLTVNELVDDTDLCVESFALNVYGLCGRCCNKQHS